MFNRPTIYVSHAIRGTNDDMEGNCNKAIKGIARLRKLFPEVDFYLPADGDLVLQILYNDKKLSEIDILGADLKIIENCHGWIFYHFDESRGSEIERGKAIEQGLVESNFSNDIFFDISKASCMRIRKKLMPIVQETITRFRRKK